jgi:hypothetical protein
MKKALSFGCKTLLLHNIYKNGDYTYAPKRDTTPNKNTNGK